MCLPVRSTIPDECDPNHVYVCVYMCPTTDQHVTTADLMLIAFNVTPHTPYHTWLDTTQRPPEPRSLGERALMHATQERKLLGSPIVQWSRFTNPNPTPTQASRSVTQGQQQPLHAMAHALMDACGTYVAPNLALGLFLSAARARCAVSAMQREETRDMLAAKAGTTCLSVLTHVPAHTACHMLGGKAPRAPVDSAGSCACFRSPFRCMCRVQRAYVCVCVCTFRYLRPRTPGRS